MAATRRKARLDEFVCFVYSSLMRKHVPYSEEEKARRRAVHLKRIANMTPEQKAEYNHRIAERRRAERPRRKNALSKQDKARKSTDAYKEKRRLQHAKRYKEDQMYVIVCRLRSRLNNAMKAKKAERRNSLRELIGCSVEFLSGYLEARFKEGMSWENKGQWHIDHIIPCVKFDLKNPEEAKRCFHYSNLQPLWSAENLSKWTK